MIAFGEPFSSSDRESRSESDSTELRDRSGEELARVRASRRTPAAIAAFEVEADLAPFQLQSSIERLAGFRSKALEQRALTLLQQRLGRPDADRLAGDRLPDGELAALLPAAASVRLRLIDDVGAAQRATAQCRRMRSHPPVHGGEVRSPRISPRPAAGPSSEPAAFRRRACALASAASSPCSIRPEPVGRPGGCASTSRSLAGLRWPPVGTGISVRPPLSVRWRMTWAGAVDRQGAPARGAGAARGPGPR